MKTQIKAESLRIGNLVQNDLGVIYKIALINNEDDADTKIRAWQLKRPAFGISNDRIEPIELTEDWLIKMGSEKLDENIFKYGRFQIVYYDNLKYWGIIDMEHYYSIIKVNFVHEWQNFIYIMNKEELTIKE